MKKLILLTVIILSAQLIQAQSYVTYTYDNAGNRLARQTIILKNTENNNYKKDKISDVNYIFGKGNITVYPNPVKELLNIQFTDINTKNDIILQLYDINGKLLQTKKTKNYKTTVNLSSKTAGVYILKVLFGNGKAEFTIVKQ